MRAVKITTAAAIVAVLTVLVVGAIGAQRWNRETDDACVRIHRVVVVGAEVIASTRTMIAEDYRDRRITRQMRDRAYRRIDAQLVRWRSADCVP